MSQFINSVAYQLYLWDSNINSGGDLGWQYYSKRACWEHEIDKKIDGIDCYTNNPMMATEILIQK